jgi:hypothetical protein
MALLGTAFGALALAAPAAAEPASKVLRGTASAAFEFSSQERQPRARLRVYPGRRMLSRECSFRLVQEWRPSGTYVVPRQRCWWVRG